MTQQEQLLLYRVEKATPHLDFAQLCREGILTSLAEERRLSWEAKIGTATTIIVMELFR